MKSHVITSTLLAIAVFGCDATPATGIYEAGRVTIVETLPSGQPLRIDVDIVDFEAKNYPYDNDVWWGSDKLWGAGSGPITIISKISITYSKKRFVPLSVYSDLTDIIGMKLTRSTSGAILEIEGGHTSSHYFANLVFDNDGFLVKRKVYKPTFPDEVWEETHYSYIRREDM